MNVEFQLAALEVEPRPRSSTIGQRVFDALKLAIVQLQLRPGNLLSEAEVAKQMGVSRQPVREAFIKLSEVGLVEIRPQRGTYVVLISRRDVENAQFIREAIEVAIVRKASASPSSAHIAELRELVERQRLASATGDHAYFLRLDEALHRTLARSVDCDHAWRVVESMKAQLDRVRYLSIPLATPIKTLIDQHEQIIEAIAAGDADGAAEAMSAHLSEILRSLPKIAQAHPDMFHA